MWPTHSGRFLFKVSSLLEVELVVERNLFDIRNDRCASCGLGPLLSELQRGDLVAVLLGQQEASFGKGNAVIGEFPLGLIQFKDRKSSVIRVVFTAKAVNRYLPVCPIGTEIDVVVVVFLHIESPFKVAFTQLYVINVVMFM